MAGQGQQEQQAQQFIEYLKANRPDVLQEIGKLPQEQQIPALMQLMQQSQGQASNAEASPTTNEPVSATPNIPPEADGQRIKQELIDIVQAQG